MNSKSTTTLLVGLMILASVLGVVLRPPAQLPSTKPTYLLESMVPKTIGDWREFPQGALVVNPQTQQLLDRLYNETLTRTYVNNAGYRIMLSLAYGGDQRGELQAHKPEVCYPAQGFALHSNEAAQLATRFGSIDVRQLKTSLGPRHEPVTYWFTMNETVVQTRFQQRLQELRFKLTGQIPNGLLFRVSSIDDSPGRAFEQHRAFVDALLTAIPAQHRQRLSGLSTPQL